MVLRLNNGFGTGGNSGGVGGIARWADLLGKPATFPPSAHSHEAADIAGLQTLLNGKMDSTSFKTVGGLPITGQGDIPISFDDRALWDAVQNLTSRVASLETATGGGAPMSDPIPAQSLVAGTAYNADFTANFSDPDGDPLTFSITAGSLPLGITRTGAAFAGTPTVGGVYTVTLTATDPSGKETSRQIVWTIGQAPAITAAPVISATGTVLDGPVATVAGYPIPTPAFQWYDGDNPIPGATSKSYDQGGAYGAYSRGEIFTNGVGSPATTRSNTITVAATQALSGTVTPLPLVAGQPAQIVFNEVPTSGPTATGVTFTGSGTTWDFTVPDDIASLTIGATKTGFVSYAQTFDVAPDPNAYTIQRTSDYALSVDTDMTSGTIIVPILEHEDSRYIGEWQVDAAELQTGPVIFAGPFIDEQEPVGFGLPYAYKPAMFLGLPRTSGDEFIVEHSLRVNGAAKADGLYGGGENAVRAVVTDQNGTREKLSAPVIVTAPTQTMTRNSVQFNGTTKLQHGTSLGTSTTSFLIFAQFTKKTTTLRQYLFNIGGASHSPVQLWDADIVRSTWQTDPSGALTASGAQLGSAVADQRVTLLINGHTSGSNLVIDTAHLRNNALTWVTGTVTATSRTAFKLAGTIPGFSIGSEHLSTAGFNQPWLGLNHRLAFWINTGTVDLTSADIRKLFIEQDTDNLIVPDASYGTFGTPLIDLYGPAADYNDRKLNGTIGTADTLVGTFTNG